MELHEHLRELRKKAGYSQEELAEKLNISRQAVSKWENGTANPDVNNLIRLGELYQVSTDFILFGNAPATKSSASDIMEQIKETPSADMKRHTNGYLWLGFVVLAILILYFATNGF